MDAPIWTPNQPLPDWLKASATPLIRALHQDRLHHAWLVQGEKGWGMSWLFSHWVAHVLCEQQDACGHCRSCRLLESQSHPDVHWLQPEDRPTISVEQVRALAGFVWETPQIGAHKVVVLAPAESMTPAAANALLKTLEEPPGYMVMLLGTFAPGTVLPTIKSRCNRLTLETGDATSVSRWLQAMGVEDSGVDRVSEALALGLTPFELLGDVFALTEGLRKLGAQWDDWLNGTASLAALAQDWGGRDQDALTAQLIRVLHARALKTGADYRRLQVVAEALHSLLEMRRLIAEKRNLNPVLFWESWLLNVRKNLKGKGDRA